MSETTGISGVYSSAVAAKQSTAEEADRRHDYEKSTPEEDSRGSQKSSYKGTDEMSGISWFKTKRPDFAAKMGLTQPIVDNKEYIMAAPIDGTKQIDDNVSPAVAAKGEQQSKFGLEDSTISQKTINERMEQMSGTAFVAIVGFVLIYIVVGTAILGW